MKTARSLNIILSALQMFVGITAILGGIGLVSDPSGAKINAGRKNDTIQAWSNILSVSTDGMQSASGEIRLCRCTSTTAEMTTRMQSLWWIWTQVRASTGKSSIV
jgi:hypothetical protein